MITVPPASGRNFRLLPRPGNRVYIGDRVFRIQRVSAQGLPPHVLPVMPIGLGDSSLSIRSYQGQGRKDDYQVAKCGLGDELVQPTLHPQPIRLVGGSPLHADIPYSYDLPRFIEGPTLSIRDDVLIISFTASRSVWAEVLYGFVSRPNSQVDIEHPHDAIPPNRGETAGYRTGQRKYHYFCNTGGYSALVQYKDNIAEEHNIELPGMVAGASYNVKVGIYERRTNGPEFSDDNPGNIGPVYSLNLEIKIPEN